MSQKYSLTGIPHDGVKDVKDDVPLQRQSASKQISRGGKERAHFS